MFLDAIAAALNNSIHRYESVISYLATRYVSKEDIDEYRLGYSKFVTVPEDDHEDRERFLDSTWKGKKFCDKVVFPIQDAMGRVVGLSGRAVDSKLFKTFVTAEAKYIGCFFYGFYQALPEIYKTGTVYVVEGPFDCHALRIALPNTIASLTSGIYANQHDFLKCYCKKIVVVFDDDPPGREGAEKASKYLNVDDLNIGYGDPANCLEKLGKSKFISYVKKKVRNSLPPF